MGAEVGARIPKLQGRSMTAQIKNVWIVRS